VSFYPCHGIYNVISRFNLVWILLGTVLGVAIIFSTPQISNDLKLEQLVYDLQRLEKISDEESKVVFFDKTLEAGILTPHSQKSGDIHGIHESLGAGVCSFDFNNDGWLDILVLTGTGSTHYFGHQEWWQSNTSSAQLYQNNQNGTFNNISKEVGLVTTSTTIGCAIGDFDLDGYQDIFLANRGKNEVWKNSEASKFEKINDLAIEESWSTSAAISDFNNDGLPDIYIANYLKFEPNSLTFEASSGFRPEKHPNFDATLHSGSENSLLINKGNWQFEEQAVNQNVSNAQGRGLATKALDVNSDGLMDILVANDSNSENKLFINQGETFSDKSTQTGLGVLTSTTGISALNSNESQSLFISSGTSNYSRLYQQADSKPLRYADQSDQWKLNQHSNTYEQSWPPAIADFNLDGYQDILVPNGQTGANDDAKTLSQNQTDYLLMSTRTSFSKQTSITGNKTSPVSSSRCAVAGDFNNDGNPDALIASNNGLPQLLINQAKPKHWVGFIAPNYAIASDFTLTVKSNNRVINYSIFGGTRGFCWQDNTRIILPLEKDEVVIEVLVQKNDVEQRYQDNFEPNTYYLIDNDSITPVKPANLRPKSRIKLNNLSSKISVIKLLIDNDRYELALQEMALIKDHPEVSAFASQITAAIESLPITQQIKLAPSLLRSDVESNKLMGIAIARRTESDLLARWLFPLINDKSPMISCAAIEAIEHFFTEEEAVILTKYASLNGLIKQASSSSSSAVCAIKALGEAERYRAVAPLIQLLESPSDETRYWAISSLGRIRERDALDDLKQVLRTDNETPKSRVKALNAIKQIDSRFNTALFVKNDLLKNHRSTSLALIASLEPLGNDITPNTIIELRRLIISQPRTFINDLSNREKVNYYKIANDKNSVTNLKKIANTSNTNIAISALKALIAMDSGKQIAYLSKLKKLDHTYPIEQAVQPAANINQLSELISHYKTSPEILSAIISKTRPHLLSQYLANYIKLKSDKLDEVALKIILDNLPKTYQQQLCQTVSSAINTKPKSANLFEILKFKPDLLLNCIKQHNLNIDEQNVRALMHEPQPLREQALTIASKLTSRWARQLTSDILNNPTNTVMDKRAIVKALRSPLSPSRKRSLIALFKSVNNPELVVEVTKKLASDPSWLNENQVELISIIENAIENNEEKSAIAMGKLLYTSNPSTALDHLLH